MSLQRAIEPAWVQRLGLLDPLRIQWSYAVPGQTAFLPAGTSSNQVYVSWKVPVTTHLFHTVLDVACRNALGQTLESHIVAGIWSDFEKPIPGVRSWDGIEMKYWPDGYHTPSNRFTFQLVADKKGRCGA